MRPLIVALVLSSSAALAAEEVELHLPPSASWVEVADPVPVPSPTVTSRYFTNQSAPGTELRVMKDTTLRLDYSLPVVKELSARFVAAQKQQGGAPSKVSDPRILVVEGVNVGTFQVMEAQVTRTLFYLPSEGGDRVVGLVTPRERQTELREILTLIGNAHHLRKPDAVHSGTTLMGVMAGVSLTAIAVLLFLMRKKD